MSTFTHQLHQISLTNKPTFFGKYGGGIVSGKPESARGRGTVDETASKGTEMRSTETLYLRVLPEVRARAIEGAQQYGIPISDFVGSLILGVSPVPKLAVEIGSLAVLGQRVVAALAELPSEAIEAREALVALRRAIVELILARRGNYDAHLDQPGAEGSWVTVRHWRER